MWEKSWSWTKFITLMLCVGVIPFTPDIPAPLALAFVVIALAATAAMVIRHISTASRRIVAPVADLDLTSVSSTAHWQLLRPEAPGTPGTVRSRAPSLRSAALG